MRERERKKKSAVGRKKRERERGVLFVSFRFFLVPPLEREMAGGQRLEIKSCFVFPFQATVSHSMKYPPACARSPSPVTRYSRPASLPAPAVIIALSVLNPARKS